MPIARPRVRDLGRVGYIADIDPIRLPVNGWSFLQNARCEDGSIGPFLGYESLDTVTPAAETIQAVQTGQSSFLAYAGGTAIYRWRNKVEAVIASGLLPGTGWDSTVLGGVAIFTNGVQNPYFWGGSGNAEKLPYDSTDPDNVCYWDDPEIEQSCRLIRTFKYYLFGLDVTDCAGRNCRKIIWSHPAEPGTVPITWNPLDVNRDASSGELSDTPGCILDAKIMRDTLQIYKTDAVYQVTYTGDRSTTVAQPIFNIRLVSDTVGLFARGCVVDVGGIHFVVGDKAIYLYDGNQFKPIADERVKNLFFNGVSRANRENSFVTFYEQVGEVWLCYPEGNNTFCNVALVYSLADDTWSQRELPAVTAAAYALVDRSSGYTWDTLPAGIGTWSNWATYWAGDWDTWIEPLELFARKESLILAADGEFYEMDRSNQADGANIECIVRRLNLELEDQKDYHGVLRIYIYATGGAFQVRMGFHEQIGGAVTWTDYQTFTPGTDRKLDFEVYGMNHAIEFYSNADVSWTVSGYELDVTFTGEPS